ncbi:hypothetical protein FQR65_LT16835 [Abscondita terminalis]|nr:hypothetical protein FQR65_LT16835 [Abscondita terminalis]
MKRLDSVEQFPSSIASTSQPASPENSDREFISLLIDLYRDCPELWKEPSIPHEDSQSQVNSESVESPSDVVTPRTPKRAITETSRPQGQYKPPSKRTISAKGEKLMPKKTKIEMVPKKMEDAVQDTINLMPPIEWDNMVANNEQLSYTGQENEINNVVNDNASTKNVIAPSFNRIESDTKGCKARLYAECMYPLNKSHSKWIKVGLIGEIQFEPVVKFMDKGQNLTLTEKE